MDSFLHISQVQLRIVDTEVNVPLTQLLVFAVLLCNSQWGGRTIPFKAQWAVRFVFFLLSLRRLHLKRKGCKTSSNAESNSTHYCCSKNFRDRPTQAVALGKATLNHNKQNFFGWVDFAVHHTLTICFQTETAREKGSICSPRPTLLLIGPYIKAFSHR